MTTNDELIERVRYEYGAFDQTHRDLADALEVAQQHIAKVHAANESVMETNAALATRVTELEAEQHMLHEAWAETRQRWAACAASLDAIRKLAGEAEPVSVCTGSYPIDIRRMVPASNLLDLLDASPSQHQAEAPDAGAFADALAKAWDEGFDAGEKDAWDVDITNEKHVCTPNPYRTTEQGEKA